MRINDDNIIGRSQYAYLIGIGGAGMSGLARVLKQQGLKVAGSDSRESKTTRDLVTSGIPVMIGQTKAGYNDADLIIYSSAIRPDHIELQTARNSGRKVYHRAEILSSLLNRARTSIAVTGTHGKTTTSSMISFVLSELGKNPTCLIGGDLTNFGTNTVLGNPDLWVSEVDESDKSHELYAPNYAIVTNLEIDHIDNYKDLNELQGSFARFFENTRDPGLIIYSDDDFELKNLVIQSGKPRLGFGLSASADFSARNIHFDQFGSEFDLFESGFFTTRMRLSVPGVHNITNALAVIAVLVQLGLVPEDIGPVLQRFRGARRRLEIKCQTNDIVVIDDYAHHPTEVRASIKALRALGKRVTVIFQPHRYSRTQYFFREFATAFEDADELILTDIYGAGELNTENISVNCIYDEMNKVGQSNVEIITKSKIIENLSSRPNIRGVIAFIGAGDIGDVADEFANRYKNLTPA